MRYGLLLTTLFSCVAPGLAVEYMVGSGTTLTIPEAGVSVVPGGALKSWRNPFEPKGPAKQADDGGYVLRMIAGDVLPTGEPLPSACVFAGTLRLEPLPDGGLRAGYELTPSRDIELETLHLSISFSSAVYGGGRLIADEEPMGVLPETMRREAVFFARTISRARIESQAGDQALDVALEEPRRVVMQDNRKWGAWDFTLRIPFARSALKAGETTRLAVVLRADSPFVKSRIDGRFITTAGDEWIRLEEDLEIVPGSALDFSGWRQTGATAGGMGRVLVKGDHFEFERQPGVPQRFWGVNVCMRAVTPERESARRFAANLARLGYNAVRLHHHESQLVTADGEALDPDRMARFDELVAACIENGIYLATDFFSSRQPIPFRRIGINRDGSVPVNDYKELVLFHEGALEEFKRWTRMFLGHVNPATGRSLAQEPALVMISLVNEGNAGNRGMSILSKYPEAAELYRRWLRKKQEDFPERFAGVPDTLPSSLNDRESRHQAAFTLFLGDLEARFSRRMRKFLRSELGCLAPVSDMNGWHVPVSHMLVKGREGDCVDDHFYVDHPLWIEQPWRLPAKCLGLNPVKSPSSGAWDLALRRSLDKPMAVSEFGYPAPNPFRGACGLIAGSLAALQDWSALWHFAWSHDVQGLVAPQLKRMDFFNLCGDPLSVAAARAGTCLFLRGDMKPLTEEYAIVLDREAIVDEPRNGWLWHATPWSWAAWHAKVGFTVNPDRPTGRSIAAPEAFAHTSADVCRDLHGTATVSPKCRLGGGQVAIDRAKGSFLVQTPMTAGGFAEDGSIAVKALSASCSPGPAAVWASSLDGKAIGRSSHLLVTHLTDLRNERQTFADSRGTVLLDWGTVPHLVRAGTAAISVAMPKGEWGVWALSTGGRRRHKLQSKWRDGRIFFSADVAADPQSATVLYEISFDIMSSL